MKEYFCKRCGQLRLFWRTGKPVECGNCLSRSIVVGEPGELNRDYWKQWYAQQSEVRDVVQD